MTLGFDFHPEARAEFVADVDWYDAREVGVGERFEVAVRGVIDAAVDSPESWAVWHGWGRQPVVRSKGAATTANAFAQVSRTMPTTTVSSS